MPYQILQEARHMHVVLSGTVTEADLQGLIAEAAMLERAQRPALPRLIDLRTCTGLQLDFGAMVAMSEVRTAAVLPNAVKSAVIAHDAVHYGFARMFQDLNRNPAITVAIFPTEKSALAWLLAPGFEPPSIPWAPA